MIVSKDMSDTSQIFAKDDKPQDPAFCRPHYNYTEMYGGKKHVIYICCVTENVFVQCSVEQEEMLRKHTESLQQERAELHSCISELEEENLNLKEHLQELTGAGLSLHIHSEFIFKILLLSKLFLASSMSVSFTHSQDTTMIGGTVTQKYMKMLQWTSS